MFRVSFSILILAAATVLASGCDNGGGGGAKKSDDTKSVQQTQQQQDAAGVDGSFISECMSGVQLIATFAPEGNWVDQYTFKQANCRGIPTVTRLDQKPTTDGKLTDDRLFVKVAGSKYATFSALSIDSSKSTSINPDADFHSYVKYEGTCFASSSYAKQTSCAEEWDYVGIWSYGDEHYPENHYAATEIDSYGYKSVIAEDNSTSYLSAPDWASKCKNPRKITVKAGRFEACQVEFKSYTLWYGHAPYAALLKVEFHGTQEDTTSDVADGLDSLMLGRSVVTLELSQLAF